MENEKFSTARRGFRLACIVSLCVGAAVATWAVGEMPQSEVYDGLANTTYSSGYMNRGSYSGSVNSVGYYDAASVVIGAGAEEELNFASPAFTLFGRYAKASVARSMDARPYLGCAIIIR